MTISAANGVYDLRTKSFPGTFIKFGNSIFPNAEVPYIDSATPSWLRKILEKEK